MVLTLISFPTILDTFPARASEFIRRVIMILSRNLSPDDFGLFVFGSLSHNRDTVNIENGTSDADLLVIVADHGRGSMKKTWKELNALEQVFFDPGIQKRGIVASILRAVERQTGMHENIFLTKLSDFKNARFSSIFKTNEIISKILAPSTIVMGSALCHMTFVFGNKEFDASVKQMHASLKRENELLTDLFKSLLMNTVLTLGGIFLLPLTPRATRYAIEATKWSLYAATYSISGERPSKKIQRRFFKQIGVSPAFLDRWLQLSEHYVSDTSFTLQALWNVIKIHCLGFKIKSTTRS
ncbi:MAG TPA: hypothetical protein VKM55_27360 [Candidatus Lokiarchaeia archaeon]|nr:hypothetical protein [Candidatus Lokiarchaeia archaeon]